MNNESSDSRSFSPSDLLKTEPVLLFLEGFAGVVNLVLLALVALNTISWDGAQVSAVVAAIQGGATLMGLIVRAAVVSPATNETEVRAALFSPSPQEPQNPNI